MRISYDRDVDASYIRLTDLDYPLAATSVACELPAGVGGDVILDFSDGVLVGIEVLGARNLLPPDLLAQAADS